MRLRNHEHADEPCALVDDSLVPLVRQELIYPDRLTNLQGSDSNLVALSAFQDVDFSRGDDIDAKIKLLGLSCDDCLWLVGCELQVLQELLSKLFAVAIEERAVLEHMAV